ncbi:hypothetical protein ABID58_007023 [Bradyrhizobium sp. S3.2.6]|uniref:hypothetical protein n=1 Tax=Bradyrhizobium sp. S3.2.6 TaxID=3156428 RepID=UPI00339686EF
MLKTLDASGMSDATKHLRIDAAGLGFGAGREEILPVIGGVDFGLCVAKSGPIQTKAGFPSGLAASQSVIVLLTAPSTGSFGSLEPNFWVVSPHAGTGREMALAPLHPADLGLQASLPLVSRDRIGNTASHS